MIRHILLALSASPLVGATLPHDAVWNPLEEQWDMPLHPLAYHPPKGCKYIRNAKNMAEDRVERVMDCRQDDPVEFSSVVLPDQRTARAIHAGKSRSGPAAKSGGAHSVATHGTSSSWELCYCGDDTPRELEGDPPKPVRLPGSIVLLVAAIASFLPWRP